MGSNPTAVTLHAFRKHQKSAGGSPQLASATEVQGQLHHTLQLRHRPALPGAGPVQRLQSSLLPELTRTLQALTVWPSGLRRWLKAPVRKGVGSNPTAVTFSAAVFYRNTPRATTCSWETLRPPPAGRHLQQTGPPRAVQALAGRGTGLLCLLPDNQDSLAEWSKALASGASPKGRGFEPRSCHFVFLPVS